MPRSALALLFLVPLAGCGGDGKVAVAGTLTLDGQPVANGTVTFVKSEGGAIREGAVVRDGAFEVKLPPGRYRIEVNGQRRTGTRKQKGFDGKEEEIPLTEEMFPARYNTKTELNEEITSSTKPLKLDLKSSK
ncbi:MAG TPA: carboxypeptidase-like regulatory domain-containing protein [Urbifossiella sp.]|jgi:hypothetical protein|nr:carboxypeptidase-like regulatory domain-containing protein [Urbifossiella sp.]